jgi:predicted membrane protein
MDAFAQVVLVIFILIRVFIAVGLVYLIYYEVRKIKRKRREIERIEKEDGNEDGKHSDDSTRNRNES